ncbi:hypothetical protein [Streptomyces sp. NBC_00354]|uniref:hypothetical protein n=1 Tax=Streptomyces sp. NBC_00354 TaxID=2975723 RepID=UPI002E271ACD
MAQAEAVWGDGGDECGRPRQWGEDGLAVFRRVPEHLDLGWLVLEGGIDAEDLSGRSVVAQDGRPVPAWCAWAVFGFLVKEYVFSVSDGEPGNHVARKFTGASEYLAPPPDAEIGIRRPADRTTGAQQAFRAPGPRGELDRHRVCESFLR